MILHSSVKSRQKKKGTSYGRIKEATIGGFNMSKKYQNIKQYENMILELKSQGSTHREIGEKLGLRYIQVKNV